MTSERTPPAYYSQIQGEVADRSVNVESPYVNYLVPNVTKVKSLKVRQAIAMATDATSWITAGGGDRAYLHRHEVDRANPAVVGYQGQPCLRGTSER